MFLLNPFACFALCDLVKHAGVVVLQRRDVTAAGALPLCRRRRGLLVAAQDGSSAAAAAEFGSFGVRCVRALNGVVPVGCLLVLSPLLRNQRCGR